MIVAQFTQGIRNTVRTLGNDTYRLAGRLVVGAHALERTMRVPFGIRVKETEEEEKIKTPSRGRIWEPAPPTGRHVSRKATHGSPSPICLSRRRPKPVMS